MRLLPLRSHRSRGFEIGSCRQHSFFYFVEVSASSNINEVIRAVLNSLFFFFLQKDFTHTHKHIHTHTQSPHFIRFASKHIQTNSLYKVKM